MQDTADVPLAPVENPVISVLHRGRGEVGCVARRDGRLGHGERRLDLSVQLRLDPSPLLLGAAVGNHGVAVDVRWRITVGDLLRERGEGP